MALGVRAGTYLLARSMRRTRNTVESASRLHRVTVAFPATVLTFRICQHQRALPKRWKATQENPHPTNPAWKVRLTVDKAPRRCYNPAAT
jgi:hypothetical protein